MFNRAGRAFSRLLSGGNARQFAYPGQFATDMDLPHIDDAPRLYLIASTPRSGSHFLGHALARVRHFGVPLEYLNPHNYDGWRKRFGSSDPTTLLKALIKHRTGATGWFGLKAHWSQYQPYLDGELFAPYGGLERAIFIYRRDLLAQAISYMRAVQTHQFISGAARQGEARYNYARLIGRADNIRRQNAAWANYFRGSFGRPVLTVVYEDLLRDQTGGFAAIGRFIDPESLVTPETSPRTQRQSDGASEDWRQAALAELRDEHRWTLEPQAW